MKKSHFVALSSWMIIIFIIILTACTGNQNGAALAIEAYIQALSNKDKIQLTNLSCSDWEVDAILEMDSLTGEGSKVENLSCEQTGQEGSDTYISCKGVLALDYNGEAQQIDLSTRTYIARQQSGEWLMCGYH